MAEILLGRSSGMAGFEKLVVLKRIRPEMRRDPEFVRMFLDEARLAATLHHSNVVQVYDIGEEDGSPFFAMEYLVGEDLRAVQREAARRGEPVPLEHTLAVVIGVCAGLHYAHTRVDAGGQPLGIVHRDVSPGNVAVTYDGGVKVVDFGVAKTRAQPSETRSGTVKGKVQYMSPEQCAGEPLDGRSDVFAIAVLLWELTCGRTLFRGGSDFAIMRSIVEGQIDPPSRVRPETPPELERIVMKGLARRPEDRYRTAEELQLALEAFAREQRLAVSAVGLARYLRELFSGRVEAWSTAKSSGALALESFALSRIDELGYPGEATVRTPQLEKTGDPSPPGEARRTRAVARATSRRPRTPLLVGVGTLLVVGVGVFAAFQLATPRPPAGSAAKQLPSTRGAASQAVTAPPPAAAPPKATAEPPEPPAVAPPKAAAAPHGAARPSAPAIARERHEAAAHASRPVRAHAPSPSPSPSPSRGVDLDAPLPPK